MPNPIPLLIPSSFTSRTRRRAASLSRNVPAPEPKLVHTLQQAHNSVLSLSTDEKHIYSGSQSQDISVWCRQTFKLKTTLRGHTGSVLALEYAPDKRWLFSASVHSHQVTALYDRADSSRIWCTKTLKPLYILNPYTDTDAGDLFSLCWSATHKTIYIGCQNTSLQWYTFPAFLPDTFLPSSSGTSTPTAATKKAHKFFDSSPRYYRPVEVVPSSGVQTPTQDADGHVQLSQCPEPRAVLDIPAENVIDSAHYGYVYCMVLMPSTRDGSDDPPLGVGGKVHLATGSGDESVKLWECTSEGPRLVHTFECYHGAVLSLVARGDIIYAGCQEGYVKVWDTQTKTLVRTIIVQENVDVLSLSMMHSDVYTCSANGQVKRYSDTYDCTASWKAHDGIILSSIVCRCEESGEYRLVSGGNDDMIKLWNIVPPSSRDHEYGAFVDENGVTVPNGMPSFIRPFSLTRSFVAVIWYVVARAPDVLLYALSSFVSMPSVSSSPAHREDCRQTAIWLAKCLHQLGAHTKTLSTGDVHNPIVFAKFEGSQTGKKKPRILFYGHYDVIAAPPEGWDSDPFHMTARNGYLYGRGVTDDKGPTLAVACAAAALLETRRLGIDLIFLIEGEEETGSVGFREAIRKHKELIGHVDAILVSNSTWIACDTPCITYGLRGVVHCNIEITSKCKDSHSGVEGGGVDEPMQDMVQLLSKLMGKDRKVLIPGFYDCVRPQDEEEKQLFKVLESVTQSPASSLAARWREPSLTIHNVEGSGPRNPTVIPGTVKAQVSLRIVPDQELDTIGESLCQYVRDSFKALESPNSLKVAIDHTADWWLGNLEHPWFKALEGAIQDEWGVEPLRIREGGSIPSVPFLEKEFNCPALHLPMGQSSDQAHLPNERISLSNLRRGKSVIERFLMTVAKGENSRPTLS
ncbi:hypothetical protein EW146_g1817 [Bondarzewia mesenterica]|uniref:Peptidase M20 dimerisation domain-containing protein n=1 Tax=Bondarzewia mesenterica TaxID=1095465 RepID=A0A4S4M2J7_9AGAM|nr:hypothetical protein EW146_g1817 [Bondarzewia mesenterica]